MFSSYVTSQNKTHPPPQRRTSDISAASGEGPDGVNGSKRQEYVEGNLKILSTM